MRTLTLCSALLLSGLPLVAQEWPQWRGPDRDGVANGTTLPGTWPERLQRKWQVEVGTGHSSPIVSKGRVYQFGRLGERESLTALEPASGRVIWQESYAAPYTMNSAARGHGKGPKSTPVIHAGKIYTLGISGILSCFDAGNGKLVWQKEFGGRFGKTSPLYGTAMSPIVRGSTLIAHVGGHGGGALAAFDLKTGEEKWAWAGDGPGYASPVVLKLGGTEQLVTQTENKITGFSPDTGKLLWEKPLRTPYSQNIVSAVVHDGLLIESGLRNPTVALRITQAGGRWSAETVWENQDAFMYMNSPVLADGLLYGFTDRNSGQYFCQDPATGEILWRGPPRAGDNAAIIRIGETLLMLTDEANLTIIRASGERMEKLAQYSVADSPTWAHPVPAAGGVLIKDLNSLALWEW